jgi:hypothetical protein
MSTKTLEALEGDIWPKPECDSYLVSTCHRLHKKPIDEFTPEDLRIMIGQSIGLRYLLPVATEMLEKDPFIQGDMYEGDLLVSVVSSAETFLERRSPLAMQLLKIANTALAELNPSPADEITTHLKQALNSFIAWNQ